MTESERPPEQSGGEPIDVDNPPPPADAATETMPAADPTPATEPAIVASPPAVAEYSSGYAPPEGSDVGQAPSWPEEHVPDDYAERPHLYVAGAFAGGFVFAKLLGALRRG